MAIGHRTVVRLDAPVLAPDEGGQPAVQLDVAPGLRVAYLVGHYPRIRHSVVRREIAALEQRGVAVERLSMRRSTDAVFDEEDRAELDKTRDLLAGGVAKAFYGTLAEAARHPARWLSAFALAWRLGRARGRSGSLLSLVHACLCRGWLRRSGADHVRVQYGSDAAFVAMLCRVLGGPSYSLTVRGDHGLRSSSGLEELTTRAAFAVVDCERTRRDLLAGIGPAYEDKVHVVHTAVDDLFLRADPVACPARPRLVCVARLSEQGGQSALIEAAARVVAEGARMELVLVGDGPIRQQLQREIDRRDLRGSVRVVGWRSGPGVKAELLAARALVLPGYSPGLPVAAAEALAVGRPVLCGASEAVEELVQRGRTGWVTAPGDVDALAVALREVLSAPVELLERLGDAGRQMVRRRHDSGVQAERLLNLIAASHATGRAAGIQGLCHP